jgi:carboxyl-terminal processing protease
MKKIVVLGIIISALSGTVLLAHPADTLTLKAKPIYGREARVMVYLLGERHYRKITLNDSLSSAILDAYIKELDNNKTYFLATDLQSFEKYRFKIDDLTRDENVDIAYDIYNVFKNRYEERMNYVMDHLVNQQFDFTADEYYETDRDKEPWAKDEAALNDIWRKIVKSQVLSLKLAGKKDPEIKETIQKRYERFVKSFNQFNSEDVFSIYMNCITEAYDPHTNYLSPKASDLFNQQMSLSLEGIGAQLVSDNDYTKIVRIVPGGPAEKSNMIHVNDLITAVAQGTDGEMVDVIGWRLDEVVKLIKGPKGTTVRLMVLPAETGVTGSAKELVFVRDRIKLEDQEAKKKIMNLQSNGKNLKLGVISLQGFYMDFEAAQRGDSNYVSTTRDVKRLISEMKPEHIDGLVIDLRNNGGGSLTEAIDLTGLFIKQGPVVQVKNSANQVDVLQDHDKQEFYSGPLVILTNRFSASASEIFAGAIQDYQRGVIVGETTYGKGTVQNVIELNRAMPYYKEPLGELKLTSQKFYRVTGSSTQHKGVSPDIKLPSALSADQYGESASPSAMPWDVINGTSFQKTSDVTSKTLSGLNLAYQERLKDDPSLKHYLAEMEDLRKSMAQTRLSLNESKRKEEIAEADRKKALYDKMNVKITKEGLPDDNVLKMDDEYLRESLLILADLVNRRIG